jgi:hypothetical protein
MPQKSRTKKPKAKKSRTKFRARPVKLNILGNQSRWECEEIDDETGEPCAWKNKEEEKECGMCGKTRRIEEPSYMAIRSGEMRKKENERKAREYRTWTCMNCRYSLNLYHYVECTKCGEKRPADEDIVRFHEEQERKEAIRLEQERLRREAEIRALYELIDHFKTVNSEAVITVDMLHSLYSHLTSIDEGQLRSIHDEIREQIEQIVGKLSEVGDHGSFQERKKFGDIMGAIMKYAGIDDIEIIYENNTDGDAEIAARLQGEFNGAYGFRYKKSVKKAKKSAKKTKKSVKKTKKSVKKAKKSVKKAKKSLKRK